MNKNMKEMKAARAKADEAALNRILCWFVGGSVLEFLLILLNKYWNHYTAAQIDLRVALGTAVKILAVAALACAAAGAFWWNNARKSGKGASLPMAVSVFMLGVSVSCFAAWFFSGAGLKLMCIAVPAVVILALIELLYQKEFFLISCQCVLAMLGVWLCGRGLGGQYAVVCYAYVAVAALLVLGSAWLCRKAQGNGGMVEFQGKQVRLFPKECNYALSYCSAAVVVLILLAAVFGVTGVLLYGAAVAWLLIMAVYYTVKLM